MAFHEKFVVLRPDHEEKEYRPPPNEPELSLTSHLPEPPDAALRNPQLQAHVSQKPPLWRKRRFWLPTATLLLFAAIIGGTLGGLTRRKDASSKPAPTVLPSPAAASTVLSDTASTLTPTPSAASTVPSDTASTLTPTPSAASALFNSSLASVSWTDSDGVGYRRLYYQDSSGTIKESAWNSSAGNWYSSNEAIANTTSKSPLAACVAGPRLSPFQLNLYFLNARGELVELYTHDGQSWSSGGMSDENIVPSPHSDLAAIWASYDGVPCYSCGGADPHLIYQDSNDKLWVVNATASGYRYTKLAADPVPGSGLAMSLEWRSEGGPGLRLYYQKGADGLISADWEDWETGSGDWEWTLHEDRPLGEASSRAPMAAFSWGDDNGSGGPLLVDILSSGPQGIDLSWRTPQGWQEPAKPDAMKNIQAYSAVAANGDRHVYALEAGSVKEFVVSTDGLSWSLVGDVPIKL